VFEDRAETSIEDLIWLLSAAESVITNRLGFRLNMWLTRNKSTISGITDRYILEFQTDWLARRPRVLNAA
jgi:hypothetical protein